MTTEQKTYDTCEEVADMLPCMKKPIVVHAKQINEPFRVNSLEGDYKQGKAGDYLMRGIDDELYICDCAVFERSYDFVAKKEMFTEQEIQEIRAEVDELFSGLKIE